MYQEEGNSYESPHESLTFYWGRKSWWHLMSDGKQNKAGSIIIILEMVTNMALLNFKYSVESWKWKQLMGNKRTNLQRLNWIILWGKKRAWITDLKSKAHRMLCLLLVILTPALTLLRNTAPARTHRIRTNKTF